jgi:hypothetical protein
LTVPKKEVKFTLKLKVAPGVEDQVHSLVSHKTETEKNFKAMMAAIKTKPSPFCVVRPRKWRNKTEVTVGLKPHIKRQLAISNAAFERINHILMSATERIEVLNQGGVTDGA